jgi:UDP-arabinose 4-epimerase
MPSPASDERFVLVTGGAGYIGSHTCKALCDSGFVPVAYDNLVHGHRFAVKWGPLVEGDLADRKQLAEVFEAYDIGAVVHFAAYAYVGESMQAPGKYFENNVANTINLLETMQRFGVETIVFSSTCATYGVPERSPIDESHPQRPVSPYGESKLFVERMLDWYGVAHGFRSAALRYFNAAGADPDGEIGEAHLPETHLIPCVIEAALGRSPAVDVFGTDYPTPDGTAIRDYVHVTDLADAHVGALTRLLEGGSGLRLNLGTGRGHSVLEVIEAIASCAGTEVPRRDRPRRPGDPAVLVADASRARRTLGWAPRNSSLATIVETAWAWHESAKPECAPPPRPSARALGEARDSG